MVKGIINQALDEYSQQVYGPEGIAYNSPSKLQYDIDANAAAARVPSAVAERAFPGAIGQGLGFLSDLAMPALALGSSPFYDTYQATQRAKQANPVDTGPYAGIVDDTEVPAGPTMGQLVNAIRNENIIDSAIGRTLGAGQNLANRFSNVGTAQAAEVTPTLNENQITGPVTFDEAIEFSKKRGDPDSYREFMAREYELLGQTPVDNLVREQKYATRPNMSDIAGLGDLGNPTGDSRVVSEEMGMTGTPNFGRPSMADIAGQVNENLIDRGNPLGDSRVASEEQGLSGFPGLGQVDPGFQNVLDAREARATQIANQQNPDYGQFFDATPVNEEKRNAFNDLLGILSLAYTGPYQGFVKGANLFNNIRTGKVGQIASRARTGLGSLGNKIGDFRQKTTGYRTQGDYDRARADRQAQARTDNMIDRIANNKTTRSNPRDAGTTQAQKDAISEAIQDRARTGQYDNDGGGPGGSSKIVCTMMNERYGFGSFRNKIWMKFHEHHGPEYQKGYHAIFLPLVKIAKGEGKINTAVRKVLEHMGRHVTADMFKIMKGKKRDTLGRIYRAIFEPACHIIGKIKSALGRG
jgi:hypothetical protein